jgi:hypothetical protein
MGTNATLGRQSAAEYAAAVALLDADPAQQQALLDRNPSALNELLDGRSRMMFMVTTPSPDDHEAIPDDDGDGVPDEDAPPYEK